ncbi:branched-chain amino acid ABC transporter permease [Bacillus dakarensis]|uniref:branched-chain amino acid ABC transporter permease n=1 Tax=Robertmurraya dakarensis TaxID=1926278 RepID=UPI0009818804|nr:branched-chain amino acid ABC transporter permease [Bacillus dakarensis]
MELLIGFAILACIYIILASSLNILIGYTGIFSMAQAAVFGVGAYAAALLETKLTWGFIPSLIGAIVIAGVISAIMAFPSLGVSGDYFIVASFGLQMLIHTLFMNLDGLTNGPAGVQRIPRPEFFGYQLNSDIEYLILTILLTAIVLWFLVGISKTGFGRVLRAIKEDETVVQSLGKSAKRSKITVTVLSGCVAAVAGSIYANYVTYISPASFTIHESIFIAQLIILGGLGSWRGATIGTIILLGLPEVLKFLPISETYAAPLRQVFFGLLIIGFMILRPQGIFGTNMAKKIKIKDSNITAELGEGEKA